RTLEFGRALARILRQQQDCLNICHFRDPWCGVPILTNRTRHSTAIYEVNGLPSIELPYRFRHIAKRTLDKIRSAQAFCWSEADLVITASSTLRHNLVSIGVPPEKISVIPNGADLRPRPAAPPDAPGRYIIYLGALQRWQGLDNLLRAMARLADLDDLSLVICSATHHRHAKPYRKLAERLGVAERTIWMYSLNETDLLSWLAGASLSVAPLAECSRNIDQGCAPLKILESMAAGVPVVASDLPSVREFVTDRVDGWLVRPDRPSELAMAIRVLLEYPQRLRSMAEAARSKIEAEFTWDASLIRLSSLYSKILATDSHKSVRSLLDV